MLAQSPRPALLGVDVEDYTTCTKSEYRVEPRTVEVDQVGPVVFSFVVNAANVVVAKKNNPQSAYEWIAEHTNG